MQEASLTYTENELDELFIKEGEILSRISPYCDTTNKEIVTNYSLSLTPPFEFILEIKVVTK